MLTKIRGGSNIAAFLSGKLAGHYPADYENRQEEGKDEQQMAGK